MEESAIDNTFAGGLVSVIIPIYNSERYLRRCIKSVITQTYGNIEILLIDDGSKDNSGEICNEFAASDSRIKVMHTRNNGPAAARNIGMDSSRGSLVFFIDSDDFIENNALNLLVEGYKQNCADMIVGNFKRIKDNNCSPSQGNAFLNNKLLSRQDMINYARCYLKKPNRFPLFAYSWGRLFKASIIKNRGISFNPDLHTFEDVAFNFDYLNYANGAYFIKEAVYNHLVHDDYASATMAICGNPKKLFGYEKALNNISGFLKNCDPAAIKKEVGHAHICLTIIQLVRTCGQIEKNNKKRILELIRDIVNDSSVRNNLQFYSPSKGDSRILPILMRLRFVWPIMIVCKYKAHRRYRKGSSAK